MRPGAPACPGVLARSDCAGATHAFAAACAARRVSFSFGFPVDSRVQRVVDLIPQECWDPAALVSESLARCHFPAMKVAQPASR